MGTRRVTKVGAVSVARVQALDLAEGLDALTSTATTDVVAGDGSGGWQRTALSSIADASGETVGGDLEGTVSAASVVALRGQGIDEDLATDKPCIVFVDNAGTVAPFRPSDGAAIIRSGTAFADLPQISAGEITAGTETAPRLMSPADAVSIVSTHGGSGGATEVCLGTILTYGFTSSGVSSPTNNYKLKFPYDNSWRTLFTIIEVKVAGTRIGSASCSLEFKLGGSSYFTMSGFSLTTSAASTTSVKTVAASSLPSSSGALEIIYTETGVCNIGAITMWGIV